MNSLKNALGYLKSFPWLNSAGILLFVGISILLGVLSQKPDFIFSPQNKVDSTMKQGEQKDSQLDAEMVNENQDENDPETAKVPTSTPLLKKPTATPVLPTNTPVQQQPTVIPTPFVDTQAPTFTMLGGPADGSTVTFSNFCFPLNVSDNVSKSPNILVRTRFDSESWGEWTTSMASCYNNIGNGSHTFAVQAKDAAGNTTGEQKRVFTVSVLTNGKISGMVFGDTNRNGVQDSGEVGIHFYKVNLFSVEQNAGIASTGTEDNAGTFEFSALKDGTYRVEAYNPVGMFEFTSTTSFTVTLSTNQPEVTNIKFGVLPTS